MRGMLNLQAVTGPPCMCQSGRDFTRAPTGRVPSETTTSDGTADFVMTVVQQKTRGALRLDENLGENSNVSGKLSPLLDLNGYSFE